MVHTVEIIDPGGPGAKEREARRKFQQQRRRVSVGMAFLGVLWVTGRLLMRCLKTIFGL